MAWSTAIQEVSARTSCLPDLGVGQVLVNDDKQRVEWVNVSFANPVAMALERVATRSFGLDGRLLETALLLTLLVLVSQLLPDGKLPVVAYGPRSAVREGLS